MLCHLQMTDGVVVMQLQRLGSSAGVRYDYHVAFAREAGG
jgi:hypothetical protein